MYKLFFCFISLADKTIYLTINIHDLIITFIFCGLFPTEKILPIQIKTDMTYNLLIIFLLILSSISLFIYFYKKTHRTICHKFYMVLRSFFLLLVFIGFINVIFDFFGESHKSEEILETVLVLIFYGVLIFLNTFWSFLIVKLCN